MTQVAKNELLDVFDLPAGTSCWKIDESVENSVVDGVNILARAVGPMFLVNGASRNKRYYSESLWNKAIDRNKDRMENGLMLGTIGHDHPLDDTALLQGMASHRVSKLWIEKKGNVGMGEILVYNTTAGRNLNAYLRGGTKFPVSSRAFGDFTGKKVGQNDEVDEDSYELHTFDFVQTPGVSQAVPKLVESTPPSPEKATTEKLIEKNDPGVTIMSTENDTTKSLLESLSTEKVQLQSDLDSALTANKRLESELTIQQHKAETSESKLKGLEDKLASTSSRLDEAVSSTKLYESVGEATDIANIVADHRKLTGQLEGLGTVEDIQQVFEYTKRFTERHGSFDSISEKLRILPEYEELGTPEKLDAALDMLAEYIELGTTTDIEKVFEAALAMSEKVASEEASIQLEKFVAETGANKTIAEKLLGSMDYDDARDVVESVAKRENDEQVNKRYRKDEVTSAEERRIAESARINGDASKGSSRASRFFERS